MIRLYIEAPLHKNQEMPLSESQNHYLTKVMRLKVGDEILIFNGADGEWKASITSILKRTTIVHLASQTRPQTEPADLWSL